MCRLPEATQDWLYGAKAASFVPRSRNQRPGPEVVTLKKSTAWEGSTMGKGILLWLIGVPIPIILLLLLFWH
ncbi:MAG: hypothetical protein WDN24_13875 [Sphingomonas sp.]